MPSTMKNIIQCAVNNALNRNVKWMDTTVLIYALSRSDSEAGRILSGGGIDCEDAYHYLKRFDNEPLEEGEKPLECIDLTAGMSFCMGNAVKYVWRYRSKNKPVEDLRKSLWYTHYAENRNEPVALTCRQLGIIDALQHQSQTEQYEFQFWNALRFGDYPKMCRAIAMMIRLAEGKNIDDINQELES